MEEGGLSARSHGVQPSKRKNASPLQRRGVFISCTGDEPMPHCYYQETYLRAIWMKIITKRATVSTIPSVVR